MANEERWTHEQSVNYESAREVITALMSFRSAWLAREAQKSTPDAAAVHQWKAELVSYANELRALDVRDDAAIARVCTEYGAEVKRLDRLEAEVLGLSPRG